jgi:Rod binding domain-containing protein
MSDINALVSQTADAMNAGKIGKASQLSPNIKADKMDASAKEFEAVFIAQMLKPMFETVETNEMFGGGNAENIYKSMMVDEYGKIIAEQGGIGLADALKSQLIEMQAQAQAQSREGL